MNNRVNLTINYLKKNDAHKFRECIHPILCNLAWLYLIDHNHEFDTLRFEQPDEVFDEDYCWDIYYFKLSRFSVIDAKHFKKIIADIFRHTHYLPSNAVMGFQTQKAMRLHKFPKDFYRPLPYRPFCLEHTYEGRVSYLSRKEFLSI